MSSGIFAPGSDYAVWKWESRCKEKEGGEEVKARHLSNMHLRSPPSKMSQRPMRVTAATLTAHHSKSLLAAVAHSDALGNVVHANLIMSTKELLEWPLAPRAQ